MRNSPIFLIALALVSALSVAGGLSAYAAAQSAPAELRLKAPEVAH